jgi:hypothetical protein
MPIVAFVKTHHRLLLVVVAAVAVAVAFLVLRGRPTGCAASETLCQGQCLPYGKGQTCVDGRICASNMVVGGDGTIRTCCGVVNPGYVPDKHNRACEPKACSAATPHNCGGTALGECCEDMAHCYPDQSPACCHVGFMAKGECCTAASFVDGHCCTDGQVKLVDSHGTAYCGSSECADVKACSPTDLCLTVALADGGGLTHSCLPEQTATCFKTSLDHFTPPAEEIRSATAGDVFYPYNAREKKYGDATAREHVVICNYEKLLQHTTYDVTRTIQVSLGDAGSTSTCDAAQTCAYKATLLDASETIINVHINGDDALTLHPKVYANGSDFPNYCAVHIAGTKMLKAPEQTCTHAAMLTRITAVDSLRRCHVGNVRVTPGQDSSSGPNVNTFVGKICPVFHTCVDMDPTTNIEVTNYRRFHCHEQYTLVKLTDGNTEKCVLKTQNEVSDASESKPYATKEECESALSDDHKAEYPQYDQTKTTMLRIRNDAEEKGEFGLYSFVVYVLKPDPKDKTKPWHMVNPATINFTDNTNNTLAKMRENPKLLQGEYCLAVGPETKSMSDNALNELDIKGLDKTYVVRMWKLWYPFLYQAPAKEGEEPGEPLVDTYPALFTKIKVAENTYCYALRNNDINEKGDDGYYFKLCLTDNGNRTTMNEPKDFQAYFAPLQQKMTAFDATVIGSQTLADKCKTGSVPMDQNRANTCTFTATGEVSPWQAGLFTNRRATITTVEALKKPMISDAAPLRKVWSEWDPSLTGAERFRNSIVGHCRLIKAPLVLPDVTDLYLGVVYRINYQYPVYDDPLDKHILGIENNMQYHNQVNLPANEFYDHTKTHGTYSPGNANVGLLWGMYQLGAGRVSSIAANDGGADVKDVVFTNEYTSLYYKQNNAYRGPHVDCGVRNWTISDSDDKVFQFSQEEGRQRKMDVMNIKTDKEGTKIWPKTFKYDSGFGQKYGYPVAHRPIHVDNVRRSHNYYQDLSYFTISSPMFNSSYFNDADKYLDDWQATGKPEERRSGFL